MPELPEVQTIVDDLNKRVKGRRIVDVWLDWPKAVKYPASATAFKKIVKGSKISKVERRGKYIKFYLDKDKLMVVHLKMTGHFLILRGQKADKYIHLIFYLDDGRMLAFSDVRKFGTVRAGQKSEVENLPEIKNLGVEPLAGDFREFKASLRQAQGKKIKQVLMDQRIVAGIGNIYSDEALWLAKIHPFRKADTLSGKELKLLWQAIRKVLNKSLDLRGTSARDYKDTSGEKGSYYDQRLVYHREGEACRRCGKKIKRVRIGGRSAHFCPKCQKLR